MSSDHNRDFVVDTPFPATTDVVSLVSSGIPFNSSTINVSVGGGRPYRNIQEMGSNSNVANEESRTTDRWDDYTYYTAPPG